MYQKLIDKGITTVLLEGDIDLYNADEFKKDISGLETLYSTAKRLII